MLGLLLLYFVWKRFADLAQKYGKSKHYGWFGILCYVGGLLSFGVILGILNELLSWGIDFENSTLLKFADIPLGLLFCYILYLILDRKWKSEVVEPESIEDIGNPVDTLE